MNGDSDITRKEMSHGLEVVVLNCRHGERRSRPWDAFVYFLHVFEKKVP